jgi:hypothetical protein
MFFFQRLKPLVPILLHLEPTALVVGVIQPAFVTTKPTALVVGVIQPAFVTIKPTALVVGLPGQRVRFQENVCFSRRRACEKNNGWSN